MNSPQTRRALTVAAVGLVAAVLVAAALLSWTRVFSAGIAILLALGVIILLDIRWRVGAAAELQRAAFREARDARSRAGAVQVALRGFGRKLDSVRERVERAERRVLGSVELANLQARDWRMDHQDAVAASDHRLTASVDAAAEVADEPVPPSQQDEVGEAHL